MSRHEISNVDGKKFVFGWDQSLQSFFLQVHDPKVEEDKNPVVWLGAEAGSIMYEVEDLVATANKNGLPIGREMQGTLYIEKDDGI